MFYLEVNTLLSVSGFLLNYQSILAIFLLANLFVGLWASRGVKSLQEYSIGRKDFSTSALTATIVSTWIGGSFMTSYLANIYTNGWYFILPFIGDSFALLITGLWLAPRMGEFLDNLSVADALGRLYGRTVQIITAICGILVSIGAIAVQFKVSAKVVTIVFGIDELYATLAAAGIVIIYSALGGVRSIVFTDIVQFFTFAAFIPLLLLVIWNGIKDPAAALQTLQASPQFSLEGFLHSPQRSLGTLGLMAFYLIPAFVPVIFQRVSMASHVQQAKRAFLYSFVLCLAITLFTIGIGVLLFAQDPHLDPNQLLNYIIQYYNYPGLKALILVGTMAIIMSTADSHLNAAAVLCIHDLGWKFKEQVRAAKLASFVLGGLALGLALYKANFLELMLMALSFYMPIVSVPLLMAIFGFRTTAKAVLIGMIAGGITVLVWEHYLPDMGLESVIPGMVANLTSLLASHYLFKQQGGWVGIKEPAPLLAARQSRQEALEKLSSSMKSSKIYTYLQQSLPTREIVYPLFGIYVMGATYALFFTLPQGAVLYYKALYEVITYSVLIVTAVFMMYPAWPATLKAKWFITFAWPLGIGYILFVVGTMLVMMSGFDQIQVMILLFNLVIAALLLPWPLMVTLASLGVLAGYLVFISCYGPIHLTSLVDSIQFKLVYGSLLFSSLLIALFGLKNEKAGLEKKNKYLASSHQKNQDELSEILSYRDEILKDLQRDEIELLDKSAAAYLRQVIYRIADYLRLEVTQIALEDLLAAVKDLLKLQDFATKPQLILEKKTEAHILQVDVEKIKLLLVNSIGYIHQHNPVNKPILILLEDALIGHRIEQIKDYTKRLGALKITITTEKDLPTSEDIYMLDQVNLIGKANRHRNRKQLIENARIVDAHYAYADFDHDHTHVYVLPLNVREVRGKVMELLREPIGADPEEVKHPLAIKLEEELLTKLSSIKGVDMKVIKKALQTIKTYHGGVKRKSGEPFFTHPMAVALILLDYCKDQEAVVAALLHDCLEDTSLSLAQVEARFGKTVARIVGQLTNLEDKKRRFNLANHEYVARLISADDKRVAYVKLADRLHNIRTIAGHSDLSKEQRIAEETMQLFVPMAKQLGLREVEEELKNLSLAVLSKKS